MLVVQQQKPLWSWGARLVASSFPCFQGRLRFAILVLWPGSALIPLPCFFWISLLFSFCEFSCFSGQQPPESLEKSATTPSKRMKIAKGKRQGNPKSKERGIKVLLQTRNPAKVTFGVPAKVTQSDFCDPLSHFWVTLAGTPKVTFESLFCVFELFGVWGSMGALPGHNSGALTTAQLRHRSKKCCPRTALKKTKIPKGPSRTKSTTESEFRYGEKIL